MSGFIVVVNPDGADLPGVTRRLQAPLAAMQSKSLRKTAAVDVGGAVVFLFANDHHDPAAAMSSGPGDDFLTYTGTLFYRGRSGSAATRILRADLAAGGDGVLDDLLGNYCLIVRQGDTLRLLTDPAGLYHLYAADNASLVTNSFIAAAVSCREHPALGAQEICEYIVNGATFGEETLVGQVRRPAADEEVRIVAGRSASVRRVCPWSRSRERFAGMSVSEHLDWALDQADRYFSTIAASFAGNVTTALSGGYDSRLVLALLRSNRVAPEVFVYGSESDADVLVARQICSSEGIALRHVDRVASTAPLDPDAYWHNQEAVFHGLDGATELGFACNPDEFSHRVERARRGALSINGGAGEIWRDFWQLPQRPYRTQAWLRSFYDRAGDSVFGPRTNRRQFLHTMADKARRAIDHETGPLTRQQIEVLYPRFRVRYWQGPNNAADNIVGHAVTPFAEHPFAVAASWIPVRAKYGGWFERQLLIRLSDTLAGYPSCYGYDLRSGPPWHRRAAHTLIRHAPVNLRAAVRQAGWFQFGPRNSRRRFPYYLQPEYLRSRFGPGALEVEAFIRIDRLSDPLAVSRALTVERMLRGEWSGTTTRTAKL